MNSKLTVSNEVATLSDNELGTILYHIAMDTNVSMTYTRGYVREVIKFASNKLLETYSRKDYAKLIDSMLRDNLFIIPNPRVEGDAIDTSQSRSTFDIDHNSTTMDLVRCRNVYESSDPSTQCRCSPIEQDYCYKGYTDGE